MILLIGNKGSMGQRYSAILKYHNQKVWGVDKNYDFKAVHERIDEIDRIIIATPTDTHFSYLKALIPTEKPILCEKPLSKNLGEVEKILSLTSKHKSPFTMTMQYSELVNPALTGPSEYNYFRHGNDGLAWDCLQVIGLAKETIKLGEDSPLWRCRINGERLNLGQMDLAYINFVDKFLNDSSAQRGDFLFQVHKRTEDMAREFRSNLN